MRAMRKTTLGVALATAILAGCGGDGDDEPTPASQSPMQGESFNAEGDAQYTEGEVADLMGLRPSDSGISWQTRDGCDVAVIMTTRSAVELYADAGDAVVTNPAGDVGVKFSASQPDCREGLLMALEAVE